MVELHLGYENQQEYNWLVVWTPLKKTSQLGWLFPNICKHKIDVPNHQPDQYDRHY